MVMTRRSACVEGSPCSSLQPSLDLAIGMHFSSSDGDDVEETCVMDDEEEAPTQEIDVWQQQGLESWLLPQTLYPSSNNNQEEVDGWFSDYDTCSYEVEIPMNFMIDQQPVEDECDHLMVEYSPDVCYKDFLATEVKKEPGLMEVLPENMRYDIASLGMPSSVESENDHCRHSKVARFEENYIDTSAIRSSSHQHDSGKFVKSPSSMQIRRQIKLYAEHVSSLEENVEVEENENNSKQSSNDLKNEESTTGELSNQGVELVQLLLSCAEAVACRDARQAAFFLKQLQSIVSPYGTSMQRVSACFVEGLVARLEILNSPHLKPTVTRKPVTDAERHEGFRLVYSSCPYVSFGHFAANSAILEAVEGETRIHVVDLGMSNALQWPSFIQRLGTRPSGPPKLLRITGIGTSSESMKETGCELSEIAAAYKVPFKFRYVEESVENIQKAKLDLRSGEALAINSMMQLHCVVKESRGSLNAVLQSIHELSPKVLTLVEQDGCHNGPFFLGRFMEALHYYSAIFDSFDTMLPRYSTQRVKMEQFHFAEEIKNIVSCEGPARLERHEKLEQWRRRMSRAGFQPKPLKLLNDARVWLQRHHECEGYTLNEEKGCLVLGWKGKGIVAASSWRC